MEYIELRNGQLLPVIGVGTGLIKHRARNNYQFFKIWLKEQIKNIIIDGFKENNKYPIWNDTKKDRKVPIVLENYIKNVDYCLIDTARAYDYSEEELGKVLNRLNDRKTFVISKMTNTHQRKRLYQECIDESLNKVGIDSFDLYLIHWPQTNTYIDSYRELIKARDLGKTKGIGVANFNIEHIECLKSCGLELPLVNEFECHPFLQQKELVNYCRSNGIQVIAYAPTGHKIKEFASIKEVRNICVKYNVKPTQVIMRWHYQNKIVPIFNTTSIDHLMDNIDIFNFSLNDKEMDFINSLDRGDRYWPDPANCDFTKL